VGGDQSDAAIGFQRGRLHLSSGLAGYTVAAAGFARCWHTFACKAASTAHPLAHHFPSRA